MVRDEYVVQGNVGMSQGSLLRIEDGCDLLVCVWEGAVWLTQQGDPRDRYIGAGGWFRLDRDGVALAHAVRPSLVTLTAPAPELYARRIVLSRPADGMPVEIYSAAKDNASFGARLRRLWAGLYTPHARPTTASL